MVCFVSFSHCIVFNTRKGYEMRMSDWSSDVCSSDLGIAGAVPAYPASCTEKTGRAIAKLAFPAGIKRGKNRQENFPQIGQRIFHFVCDEKPVPAERARLPQERDLAVNGLVQVFAGLGLGDARILHLHQFGYAVPVIAHALAPDFGGMGCKNGTEERLEIGRAWSGE